MTNTREAHGTSTRYFVSVKDGGRTGLLLGPYLTHEEALAQVEPCRARVVAANPDAHFYGFGTSRVTGAAQPMGRLNSKYLDLAPPA